MKERLLGTLVVLVAAGVISARAADMPVTRVYKAPSPPVFAWTGLYVGADVGARWTDTGASVASATLTTFASPPPVNLLVSPSCASAGLFGATPGPCPPAGASLNNVSFRVGPYVGYNWQIGPQWVIGVEEDWAWASQSKVLNGAFYPGGALGFNPGTPDASFAVKTTWDASIRARVGFLVTPGVLLYATGGPAWMHMTATSVCPTAANQSCSPGAATPNVITNSTTRLGWTVGGGVEGHLWGNWLARGEYRYADYGTWANNDLRNFVLADAALMVGYNVRVRSNTVLLGFAYKM